MSTIVGFEEAVPEIAQRIEQLAEIYPTPVILIDGRAGSGKTTLANLIREALFQNELPVPRVLPMDDLYPGWEGLRQGSNYLIDKVLTPLSKNQTANWQNWDWAKNERGGNDVGNGHRSFEPGGILIVEGCGSLSHASKTLANLNIFIERDETARSAAIRHRDGNRFDAFWEIWLSQEQEFYEIENSIELADLTVLN